MGGRRWRVHRSSATPARVVSLFLHLDYRFDALPAQELVHPVPYVVDRCVPGGYHVHNTRELVSRVTAAAVVFPKSRSRVADHTSLLQNAAERVAQIVFAVLRHAEQEVRRRALDKGNGRDEDEPGNETR